MYAWLLALLLAAVTVGVAVVAVAVERSTAIGAAVFAVAVFALGIGISLLLIASIPNQNSATAVEHNPSRVIGTEPTWTEERLPRVVSSMSPHSPRLAGLAGLVGMTAAACLGGPSPAQHTTATTPSHPKSTTAPSTTARHRKPHFGVRVAIPSSWSISWHPCPDCASPRGIFLAASYRQTRGARGTVCGRIPARGTVVTLDEVLPRLLGSQAPSRRLPAAPTDVSPLPAGPVQRHGRVSSPPSGASGPVPRLGSLVLRLGGVRSQPIAQDDHARPAHPRQPRHCTASRVRSGCIRPMSWAMADSSTPASAPASPVCVARSFTPLAPPAGEP